MGAEAAAAEARKLASRLHWAALPAPWRLEDYDYAAQPGADENLIRELATLRFIDEAANVVFIGPPGVGKTMLSVGARPRRRRSRPQSPVHHLRGHDPPAAPRDRRAPLPPPGCGSSPRPGCS